MMKAKALMIPLLVAPVQGAPDQPHLVQAWSALSTGDGLPGQIGMEHYIYTRDVDKKLGINGHVWDYGASCKKMEIDVGFKYPDKRFISGQYYLNCDAVACCYGGDEYSPPDVKKWDIDVSNLMRKTAFKGFNDTTELNDNPVKQAEHWNEIIKLPFTKGTAVTYDYYITRSEPDIISHRIDYSAPGAAPGSILYGNFTVQRNTSATSSFAENFIVPPQCLTGQIFACDPGKVAKWDRTYFKHSFASNSAAKQVIV